MSRRRPRLRSLKHKLALVFCAITGVAMVAIWFYVIPQLQTSLYHQRQQDLRRVAVPGSVPLNEAAATNIRTKPLDELVRAVADSADARVTLYGVQRSRGPDKVSWIQSDSHAAPQVDQTTAIANASARSRRVRSGYGRMNGAKVVQTAVPLVYRHRVRWVVLTRGKSIRLHPVSPDVGVGRRGRSTTYVEINLQMLPEDRSGYLWLLFGPDGLKDNGNAHRLLLANASHELRTPLFSLGGFIELLEDEDLDPASRAELLSAMHGQVDRLQKLAVDLLDLSRLDAGSFELEQERVDLAEIVEMVVSEFQPAMRRGVADVQLRLPDGGVEVTCDRERVAQIMRILVDNAIRHTPEGTPVTVSAARRNGTAKITVADWGPGLEGGEASQVFDRFFTGDAENGGAGLGLAIAKELAERMHGEIRLKSRPGRTAFTFEMPSE